MPEWWVQLVGRFRLWWFGPNWDAPVSRERITEAAAVFLDGAMTERQFLEWLSVHVGHGSYDDLEDLVGLDDDYDPLDYPDADRWFRESPDAEQSREAVRAAARRLVANYGAL